MKVFCHNNCPDLWDEHLVFAGNEANLLQSEYWARTLRRTENARPLFLEVKESNQKSPVACMLALHKTPLRDYNVQDWSNWKHRLSGCSRGWLEWLDGPVVYTDDISKQETGIRLLLGHLEEYAKGQKLAYASGSFAHASRHAASQSLADVFKEAGYHRDKWGTYLIDLDKNEDEIFNGFKRSVRKGIRKASGAGVKTDFANTIAEFRSNYWRAYQQIEALAGRKTSSLRVAEVCWEEDLTNRYQFHFAKSAAGETLAVLGVYMFNGVATEITSATHPGSYEQKLPAQDLLHWEVIKAAKRAGCHTFDLAGVNPNPQTSKEQGIRRFKEKWGGRYVEYNRFYKPYSFFAKLRSWMTK